MLNAPWLIDTKGHEWRKDDSGQVDCLAMCVEHHNGPICDKCYYTFCEHCLSDDEIEPCTATPTPPGGYYEDKLYEEENKDA